MLYDPTHPRVTQDDSWSCSCATTAWMLQSVGIYAPYPDVEQEMLSAGLVTRQDGLLVGSAGPLTQWVAERYGVKTGRNGSPVSWNWLQQNVGSKPFGIGGATWYHWSGVRMVSADGNLLLANPADGHMGVHQEMSCAQYKNLGPFTAWWIEVEEELDMGQIEELINRLGFLQGDVADAIQLALDEARRARKPETRSEALDRLQDALNTLKNEGR